MNVHHSSLFPDLIGASSYCNIQISEEYRDWNEREKAEAAARATSAKEKKDKESRESDVPAETETQAGDLALIVEILKSPASAKSVESGRMQALAEELESELSKHLVVDWEDREPALARLRNLTRITLRKFGYPVHDRDDVIDKIIGTMPKSNPDDE